MQHYDSHRLLAGMLYGLLEVCDSNEDTALHLPNSKMGGYVAQLLAPDLVFLIGVLSAATIICYQTYYQLWLSPLAKFPGPLFASVSRYYELYYDGLKPHGYGEKIRALHKLYGLLWYTAMFV
jgi:hypothetical protein